MSADQQTEPPLEAKLRPPLSEAAVARVWNAVRDARAARVAARRRPMRAGRVALAAAAAALLLVLARGAPAPAPSALRGADGVLDVGATLHGTHTLDDGSRLALGHRSELEVLANDGTRFVALLLSGRAHFSVQPGGPRRWSIETDLATVEVVGTEFTVERGESGLVVEVDHGIVLVRGERVPGRVRRLHAGERIEIEDRLPVEHREVTGERPREEPRTPAVPASTPVAPPTRARVRVVDVAERIAAADAARAAGRPEEAARILAAAEREAQSRSDASIAAFSLGRLQLERLNRPAEAAATFARVVGRGSPRALVEDAQARRVEALVGAGLVESARREARVYESRWPQGRRLTEVRALVSE